MRNVPFDPKSDAIWFDWEGAIRSANYRAQVTSVRQQIRRASTHRKLPPIWLVQAV